MWLWGWEAPSTGVNVHDHVAEEKSPTSVLYSQHTVPPILPCPRQMGGDRMTSLLVLERASSGWGPLHRGRHHLPADWDCGVIITCDCMGMLSSVLWLAI